MYFTKMFLEFLGTVVKYFFCKLASFYCTPKRCYHQVMIFYCYNYAKYYAILAILSLLLSQTICAQTD